MPYILHHYEDTEISVKVKADFTGGSIDEMNGEINVDSLLFAAPETQYFLDNLCLIKFFCHNYSTFSISSKASIIFGRQ